jgi:hypothetical protein
VEIKVDMASHTDQNRDERCSVPPIFLLKHTKGISQQLMDNGSNEETGIDFLMDSCTRGSRGWCKPQKMVIHTFIKGAKMLICCVLNIYNINIIVSIYMV